MKQATVRTPVLQTEGRLDARFFTSPGWSLRKTWERGEQSLLKLGGSDGLGRVSVPSRFRRVHAGPEEASVPFLRAFDVFNFLPRPADWLAAEPRSAIAPYRIDTGTILQTRSGRNLGPLTLTDEFLSRFVLTDDMLRVDIEDATLRYYVLGLLRTHPGQDLLRGDYSGSVIDHLGAEQVAKVAIPVFSDLLAPVGDLIQRAFHERAKARLILSDAVAAVEQAWPAPTMPPLSSGWAVPVASLDGRLDAAFHEPRARQARETLMREGGVAIRDVATVIKPAGRYKTIYVDKGEGLPLLSGRQLLQADLIGLKYISQMSISDTARYAVREGDVCFQADGRAEENLGAPILVNAARAGWLASGHVARLRPTDPDTAGWLWAAVASAAVQSQLSALAAGSTVDALYEDDISQVVLPPQDCVDSALVLSAWGRFARAETLESEARAMLMDRLAMGGQR
jgi:hypothetical protein